MYTYKLKKKKNICALLLGASYERVKLLHTRTVSLRLTTNAQIAMYLSISWQSLHARSVSLLRPAPCLQNCAHLSLEHVDIRGSVTGESGSVTGESGSVTGVRGSDW